VASRPLAAFSSDLRFRLEPGLPLCSNPQSSYISPNVSALEVIEQIKALPPGERSLVVKFVQQLEAETNASSKEIHYASAEQAKAAGDKVVQRYEPVFRKLAQ